MKLAEKTIDSAKAFFDQQKHYPSEEMWAGLTELVTTLECMADGNLQFKDRPYLSSLDPGVGKTTTACAFIRELLKSEKHKRVGVLYCVARLKEIDELVKKMNLAQSDVGILVHNSPDNSELLAKGSGNNNISRVLFTTHSMVESRLGKLKANQGFKDLEEFHYRGEMRAIKIWDESMLPAQELTLSAVDIAALGQSLTGKYNDMANDTVSWGNKILQAKHGDPFRFDDLEQRYKFDSRDVLDYLKSRSHNAFETAKTIFLLQEKWCVVRKDNLKTTLIDYKEFLPKDFYPVIILDASGRVRETYKQWNAREGVVLLKAAAKRYTNLTCHLWATGGGKESFGRQGSGKLLKLVDGITELIESKPSEEFLVVHHREDDYEGGVPNIPNLMRKQVTNPDRVKYLSWGNEKASNDYSKIPNVILAGNLFYPKALLDARTRACMGLSYDQPVTKEALRKIELGEHMNLILQAACRGSCRVSKDGDCMPMDLYVIASKASGIPACLNTVFPGTDPYKKWQPSKVVQPAYRYLDAFAFLERCDQQGITQVMFKACMKEIGVKHSSNFKNDIRNHPEFVELLKEIGWQENGRKGGQRHNRFEKIPVHVADGIKPFLNLNPGSQSPQAGRPEKQEDTQKHKTKDDYWLSFGD